MSSTSSAGKPAIILPSSETADSEQLDWIDWLYVTFPGCHTHEEIREFYVSKHGSIEAAKLAIDGLRRILRSAPKPLKLLGRYPVPGEVLHIVDISDNHQIQMWRGDLAELRQYQFAFIDTDGHPIPAPRGVRIYGVPRPDGGGTTDELFSLEKAGGMMASDIRSEVFVAPEGGVYRITGLGEEVHFSLPIHDDFVLAPVRIMNR
ncbi:hypothetical protein ARMSODRAFT_1090562 [Armillaria solidipes]|uniref:Uncharacterized protein n=1 Tax=Armillaria solidipes TaxID=1076256 RepID=A0A2H3B5T7_9AGAR|nr:hypothetical protein ARMSODRAFT_1090562 [Armillaria solidipes]